MIDTEYDDGTFTIVINQPARRNAVTLAMWRSLETILTEVRSRDDVAVLCLRGAGRESFCSGGDITEYEGLARSAGQAGQAYVGVRQVAELLRTLPCPTVAAVSGYCVGAGLVLATACDFRVCSASALFKVTAVRRGLVYPVAAAGELLALVGLARTRAILLRGVPMDAAQALSAGLADSLLETASFDDGLAAFCRDLKTLSGESYAASKRAIHYALQVAGENEEMRSLNLRALGSEHFLQSTRTFLAGAPAEPDEAPDRSD